MKNLVIYISLIALVSGCASNFYGHTKEEWQELTPEQQKEAQAHIKELDDQQYNRDLTNKKLNDLFGTTSHRF